MNDKTYDLKGMKILIVDDTAPNIDVLRKTLEPKQYEIAVALSGEAALKVAPQIFTRPDSPRHPHAGNRRIRNLPKIKRK